MRMRSREEIMIRQIDRLRKIAKERKHIFYYEALGQIRELIFVGHYEDLYKTPCKN